MRPALRAFAVCFGLIAQTFGQGTLTVEELKDAKALDDDLAKQCRVGGDQCAQANAGLLLQAQVRFAEWGYGTKFTGELDVVTTSAIRSYQQRNSLPVTGKLDGTTVVHMDKDEKAVKAYPFTLPPFEFDETWPSSFFGAGGVFRDTATKDHSGPVEIKCFKEAALCFEVESTDLTPAVATMDVKEWTQDHILAEEVALCYTSQLRIQRASKTVVHTSVKTMNGKSCNAFEKTLKTTLPAVTSEELVDGIAVQGELNKARAAAVQRVKMFSGVAQSLVEPASETKKQ